MITDQGETYHVMGEDWNSLELMIEKSCFVDKANESFAITNMER